MTEPEVRGNITMAINATLTADSNGRRETKSIARHIPTVARLLMGLLFFVFGLNGFLNFIPTPPGLPEKVVAFDTAMMNTGYMFPLIAATELIVGVLLLANRFVPLALALIAPIIVNIIAFHIFLAPASIGPGIVVAALEVYLAWAYRKSYLPMLTAKTAL